MQTSIVTSLIGLASLKDAASKLSAGSQKAVLIGSIDRSIAAEIDDICPPWPWPGPPPWAVATVSTLTFVANTLPEGGLQTELRTICTNLLERSLDVGRLAAPERQRQAQQM